MLVISVNAKRKIINSVLIVKLAFLFSYCGLSALLHDGHRSTLICSVFSFNFASAETSWLTYCRDSSFYRRKIEFPFEKKWMNQYQSIQLEFLIAFRLFLSVFVDWGRQYADRLTNMGWTCYVRYRGHVPFRMNRFIIPFE